MLGELVLPGAQGWLLFVGAETNYYNIINFIIRRSLFVNDTFLPSILDYC
jgi:hypothetical protein